MKTVVFILFKKFTHKINLLHHNKKIKLRSKKKFSKIKLINKNEQFTCSTNFFFCKTFFRGLTRYKNGYQYYLS